MCNACHSAMLQLAFVARPISRSGQSCWSNPVAIDCRDDRTPSGINVQWHTALRQGCPASQNYSQSGDWLPCSLRIWRTFDSILTRFLYFLISYISFTLFILLSSLFCLTFPFFFSCSAIPSCCVVILISISLFNVKF